MKASGGSGCIDPHLLDLVTSWRLAVSLTPRPLNPRGKRTHCSEWSNSQKGKTVRFTLYCILQWRWRSWDFALLRIPFKLTVLIQGKMGQKQNGSINGLCSCSYELVPMVVKEMTVITECVFVVLEGIFFMVFRRRGGYITPPPK
jgi:hypothetical protein